MAWTPPKTDFDPGDVLTAAEMNAIGENLDALTAGRRLGYVTHTSNVTVNQNSLASATDVFASDLTFTAVAATAYLVEFFCSRSIPGASDFITFNLVNGSGTGIGMFNINTSNDIGIFSRFVYTPGAGSISINVRCLRNSNNGTLYAGNGGTGTFDYLPISLAVFGPVTTT